MAHSGKPHLVIVGNGMAAGRLIDELLSRTQTYAITVIGDEPHGSYNRIMLSPVLAGELESRAIIQKDGDWYQAHGIHFIGGGRVETIHRKAQTVVLADDTVIGYDHLVLATGSSPARIPAENQHLDNIFAFRTLDDVAAITGAGHRARTAIVVGGGLLGLEAAYGLAQRDVEVTVVHRSPWLLNRQLDETAGGLLRSVMEEMGIRFQLGNEIQTFVGEGSVSGAVLKDGVFVAGDLAVIATGISPNKALGIEAGITTGRAIEVDSWMATSDTHISALGECCEFESETFGLVEPIWHQCVALAERLAGNPQSPFTLKPVATKLKVSGVQLFSAGEFISKPHHRELVMQDPANNTYRKILLDNDRIVGTVLFGNTRDGQFYFDLMQQQTPVNQWLPQLIFGQAYCPETQPPLPATNEHQAA